MTTALENLLACWLGPVQTLEDSMQIVRSARSIDSSYAFVLDLIGKIVGQPRNGATDAVYRRFLRARVLVNRSDTTGDVLIRIAQAVLDDLGARVLVEPLPIASVIVHLLDAPVDDATAAGLRDLLVRAKGPGVRLQVDYGSTTEATSFAFARSAHLSSLTSSGASTLLVGSTTDWPATGTLTIDAGMSTEEAIAYTLTAGGFTLGTATTFAHAARASITIQDPARGFGAGYFRTAIQ